MLADSWKNGRLRLVYDNSLGCEVTRGGWSMEKEPALGLWLRRLEAVYRDTRATLKYTWQHSHVEEEREGKLMALFRNRTGHLESTREQAF